MKAHSIQLLLLVLTSSASSLCSIVYKNAKNKYSPREAQLWKKCPPDGLRPLKFISSAEYNDLVGTWKERRCIASQYCEEFSCAEYTMGAKANEVVFHGSAYNESSSKVWAAYGSLRMTQVPGVFVLNDASDVSVWIGFKAETLEERHEEEAKEIIEKNGLNWGDFKIMPHNDCRKKKSSSDNSVRVQNEVATYYTSSMEEPNSYKYWF